MSEEGKQEGDKKERRFSQEQYDMLKRCSDKRDMTEWNEWRKENSDEDIELEGRDFSGWCLRKANFMKGTVYCSQTRQVINYSGEVYLKGAIFKSAHLEGGDFFRAHLENSQFQHAKARGASFNEAHLENAKLSVAHLEDCNFAHAFLENADLVSSFLIGAKFNIANMRGCWLRCSVVDGASKFWKCRGINRYSKHERFTDFSGIALDNVMIDPATKQLLEYNIRRMNWQEWYKEHLRLRWMVQPFWWVSDYGLSTGRIIAVFFGLAVAFACIYYVWGMIAPPGIVDYLFVDGNGVEVAWWLVPIRAIHFSVVIMTVGFTNMHANAHSMWAHILVSLQMILGFVLLGALVTRFAVLFTAGGPTGKFADKNKKEDADNGNDEVS
jgi:uncharacterized protein YjbI with pentapeptide repeats